jgi:hypothetical protein
MKKTIIMVALILVLMIGGFYTLDGYLCSHQYYGWTTMMSCAGWQGKWYDLSVKRANWSPLIVALCAALIPGLYVMLAKKHSMLELLWAYLAGLIGYSRIYTGLRDWLVGPGFIIMLFNIIIIHVLLVGFLLTCTVLGDRIVGYLQWWIKNTMHDVFLKFVIGLILFCFGNVVLIQLGVYFGVVVWAIVAWAIVLLWKQWEYCKTLCLTMTSFIRSLVTQAKSQWIYWYVFLALILLSCMYIYMWYNHAFIPYSTAWDANHAYIFLPRAWAHNNGMYRGPSWASSFPNLWFGFLTFWFKLWLSFPGHNLFGISPDGLTVMMNFWSGPLVLLASVFLIHAFVRYLHDGEKKSQSLLEHGVVYFWWLLILLWLTSGMWAFLVFIDNKTDLAVLFFAVIALYVWVQFIRAVRTKAAWGTLAISLTHQAIITGVLFAAAALAKPTGLFDVAHFWVLFLLQWEAAIVGIGAYAILIGILWAAKMMLIGQFLTQIQAIYLLIAWWIMVVAWLIVWSKKQAWKNYLKPFLIWASTIVVILVVYKTPYLTIQSCMSEIGCKPKDIVRSILLGAHIEKNSQKHPILLAANVTLSSLEATGNISNTWTTTAQAAVHVEISKEQCQAQPLQTKENLYGWLKEVIGSSADEDLGRYIWYGWKPFSSLWVTAFLPEGCYGLYADARALCKSSTSIINGTPETIVPVLQSLPQSARVQQWIRDLSWKDLVASQKAVKEIATYMQTQTIQKNASQVNIPYKLLQPFNVTFNWSLQNLSSYYTDIGIMWLLLLGCIVIGLIYGIISRRKKLAIISLITLGAWGVWWVVASGIVWYSLSIIIWTILGSLTLMYYLFDRFDEESELHVIGWYILASLGFVFIIIQFILNFTRIASQGGGGPFLRYKSNVGMVTKTDENLQTTQVQKIGYTSHDVFDLQFPHYNAILRTVNTRGKDEGVIIAGTYIQYFIDNQRNISADGFLNDFRKNASDNNVCNTYNRLRDKKMKYIVIDPNIASVAVGNNSTLIDRFLWVIDAQGHLVQQGTLTMLQSLVQQKYLSYLSSNNIVTKYSFIIPDEKLAALLQVPVGEKLLIERAKMAAARFFPKSDLYVNVAWQLLAERLQTDEGIADVADIMGKDIDLPAVRSMAKRISNGVQQSDQQSIQEDIKKLTDSDRFILQQYLAIRQSQATPKQYRQNIMNLIWQSVNNWSQLFALTVE